MPNIIDTLDQDEYWYGQDSYPHRVESMETSHIRNVIAFLIRRADMLQRQKEWREILDLSDAPDDVMHQWEAENRRALPEPAMVWLQRQPLIQRFLELLKRRESILPEQLGLPPVREDVR